MLSLFPYLPYSRLLQLCAFGVLVIALVLCSKRRLPLPPGPQGSFLRGITSHKIGTEPWKVYARWAKEYASPLISFRIFNTRIVILNDTQSILELLNRRARLYSDRPKAWMYHELCGRGSSVFNISSLDERHRQYRKTLSNGLGSRAIMQYKTLLENEVQILIDGLNKSPENYEAHIRRNAAAVIMKLAYGYTISESNDPFIKTAEESSKISALALAPGKWMVDYFPILRFVPSWLPGAGFQRQAKIWRGQLEALSSIPHDWTKKQMQTKSYSESFTSQLLQPDGPGGEFASPEQEEIIKWSAGGLYAGAADTTVSAILSFILLMSINPAAQRRAQAEIEDVIGKDQVPTVEDLKKLHYLYAVLKEVLRFAPVAPLALPHKLVEEDEYAGYRIPKGATIMANVWAIMNDESMYPSPSTFDPDRHLHHHHKHHEHQGPLESNLNTPESDGGRASYDSERAPMPQPDPRAFSYGFGRRVCPGSQFSEPVMLITMASILAKFSIICPSYSEHNTSGEKGPKIEFTTGITSRIKPFDIDIRPRSCLGCEA